MTGVPLSYHPVSPAIEGDVTEATDPEAVVRRYCATTTAVTASGEDSGPERAFTGPVFDTFIVTPFNE